MIEIISPARFIERETISRAVGRATQAGLTLLVAPACHLRDGIFAGSDDQRAYDFIRAWNSGSETLWCARGGYGAGRILPHVRGRLARGPKVLAGYSDQTYLLAHVAKYKLGKAVHGPMPVDLMAVGKQDAVDTLLARMEHDNFAFKWTSDEPANMVQAGRAEGRTIVGNLSILTRLIGTLDEPEWDGAILMLEDVEEYLYAVDRMFLHLAEAGVLNRIAGLVLGGFDAMKDNDPPFGLTVPQIALHHLNGRAIPVACGAPFGHGVTNQPIVFGARCTMLCSGDLVRIDAEG